MQFLYIDHIETQEEATKLLNSARQHARFLPKKGRADDDKSSFIGFIRWTERALLHRPVESMLASPFQRPMRYRLLFEELLKYTLPDEPDRRKRFGMDLDAAAAGGEKKEAIEAVPHPTRPGIVAALNAVGRLCDGMNEGLRHLHVVQLEKSLFPPQQLTAPGRHVILEDGLRVRSGSMVSFFTQHMEREQRLEMEALRPLCGALTTVRNPHWQNEASDAGRGELEDGAASASGGSGGGQSSSSSSSKSKDQRKSKRGSIEFVRGLKKHKSVLALKKLKHHVDKKMTEAKVQVKKRRSSINAKMSKRLSISSLSIVVGDEPSGDTIPAPPLSPGSAAGWGGTPPFELALAETWHVALLSDMMIFAVDPKALRKRKERGGRGRNLKSRLSIESMRDLIAKTPLGAGSSAAAAAEGKGKGKGSGATAEDVKFEVIAPPVLMLLLSAPLQKTVVLAVTGSEPPLLTIETTVALGAGGKDDGDAIESPSAAAGAAPAAGEGGAGVQDSCLFCGLCSFVFSLFFFLTQGSARRRTVPPLSPRRAPLLSPVARRRRQRKRQGTGCPASGRRGRRRSVAPPMAPPLSSLTWRARTE